MPDYDHLVLVRLPIQLERRKKRGFGKPYARERHAHTAKLEAELNSAIAVQAKRRATGTIDPALVFKVQMTGPLFEGEWENLGLTVLSTDADRTLVLFASSDDVNAFRKRLAAYSGPIPPGQKSLPYESFVTAVESIAALEPADRIGPKFREEGFNALEDFEDGRTFLVDLELWDLGGRELRQRKLDDIRQYVVAMEGEVFEQYIGPSITLVRLSVSGRLLRALLSVEEVQSIDLPPQADIDEDTVCNLDLEHVPEIQDADDDLPIIGIIDSGVNKHPLLQNVLVGSIAVPSSLGVADDCGHGTAVAGTAVFGDLRGQLTSPTLVLGARVCSAKVVNSRGGFDDRRVVPSQMREAITTLYSAHQCRIFVISLGDIKRPFDGSKVGTWAATLDELARDLDILIIVSAGNRMPRGGTKVEEGVTHYPKYLTEEGNRIIEPAAAINVLTVGALAHGNGLDEAMSADIHIRPITANGEPSPFTRVGPGVRGSVKPDVVDFGGTLVFDAVRGRLENGAAYPSAGVITLHYQPIERLFKAGSGTSFAAPLVGYKASQLLRRLPRASANLLRALLASSAKVTDLMRNKVEPLSSTAVPTVLGHGQVNLQHATYSDDSRVLLYADSALAIDHFVLYEIPIPPEYQSTRGRKKITVTLAFDPPVRHSRADYAGTKMSFRLLRGCNADMVSEHYRKRDKDDNVPEMPSKYDCGLKPGPTIREKGTLQRASVEYVRGIESYGDKYFLVVRCEGGWAASTEVSQRFAVVVELTHEASLDLYNRVRARVRA